MNREIENLIDLLLADGEISEKGEVSYIKKAKQLGVDSDEVEVIIDSKLQNKTSRSSIAKEVAGNITKCPACGGTVKSFSINCQDCGHEFQNIQINESIKTLINKLEDEEKKVYPNIQFGIESHRLERKISIITQFPIPNTKSAIVEFMMYSLPLIENKAITNKEALAWKTKFEQSLIKLQIISKSPEELQLLKEFQDKFDKTVSKYNKSRRSFRLFDFIFSFFAAILILYFMLAAILRIFGHHQWPF